MIKSSEMLKYGKYIDLSFPFKDPCVLICLDKYRIIPLCLAVSAVVRCWRLVCGASSQCPPRPRQWSVGLAKVSTVPGPGSRDAGHHHGAARHAARHQLLPHRDDGPVPAGARVDRPRRAVAAQQTHRGRVMTGRRLAAHHHGDWAHRQRQSFVNVNTQHRRRSGPKKNQSMQVQMLLMKTV